jgi:hypothetical protein
MSVKRPVRKKQWNSSPQVGRRVSGTGTALQQCLI